MSWTGPYPLPPRRSRSRSPPRGGYPPYPETYRADWDAYERDRAWHYERERAGYDYAGRRGRSRSPVGGDESRKRRRSLSPFERDRHDPRPRYNDDYDAHSRGYGYGSPRRGQYGASSGSRHAPADPHTFDYPASLKQYAEWFRFYYPQQAADEDAADKAAEQEAGDGSKPRNGIKAKWEKYKRDFACNQLQTMFDHHRKSPWFAEKYDPAPEHQNLRARIRKEGWKGQVDAFLLDLDAGKYDPDLRETEAVEPSPLTKENVVNAEGPESSTNGNGVAEEGKVVGGDEEMQFKDEAEEENVEGEPLRSTEANGKASKSTEDRRGITRGEEVSVMPDGNQVMIRTIPPDIGRLKLEDAVAKIPGYVYLALGDPMQKRNYYRAGWLKFTEDADMAMVMTELSERKIEGFKLHVTHNSRPFVTRVRYTPESAGKPVRIAKDLANAKALALILEAEAARLRKPQIPPAKVQKSEAIEHPKEGTDQADVIMRDGDGDPILSAATEEEDEPKENGSEAVERRIEKVMSEMVEQQVVDINDDKAYEEKKNLVSLDLYLAYLRAAFHTCYYCALTTDHVEELQRKCLKHARKPLPKPSTPASAVVEEEKKDLVIEADGEKVKMEDGEEESKEESKEGESAAKAPKEVKERAFEHSSRRQDDRWFEWLDSKIALLLKRDEVDPRDYAGKHYEDELTKAVEPHIKQEDEGKFRCKTCQKLFKATSFLEKHVANKHSELVKSLDDIPYFNNFALDPHRIQPFTHPPPVVGNSAPPPLQAFGIRPPPYHSADHFARPASHQGSYSSHSYPPPYSNGGHFDPYGYGYPVPPPGRGGRDDAMAARRLSDRISGYAPPGLDQALDTSIAVAAGLPAKPPMAAPGRSSGRPGGGVNGPPPPPPTNIKEDPRAANGRKVSYHDMDLVAEGDIELTY